MPQAWKIFRVKHFPSYENLRRSIIESITTFKPENDLDWVTALATDSFRDHLIRLDESQPSPRHYELQELLRFLHTRRVHVVVLIDNIDHFGPDVHKDIFMYAKLLASHQPPLITPVIAARFSTMRLLRENDPNAYVYFVETLTPAVSVRTTGDTVTSFLRNRLRFVTTVGGAELFSAKGNESFAQQVGLKPTQFVPNMLRAYDYFTRELWDDTLIRDLAQWRNGSLRGTGLDIVDFLSRILSGSDPLFRIKNFIRIIHATQRRRSPRQIRTLLYRYLIVGELGAAYPKIWNLFSIPTSVSGTRKLHFLPLRILEYIRSCQGNRCSYGEL
ncbi:MAG: hypothetical protein MN733_13665, partial [Nitrososphaera sp.]|nr:hypothetical protein [Nitrososphaera sp.]